MNSGSRWHRWDPHVHAPGTVLNDQFRGQDVWDRYLAALEAATPAIRVIGVTDYYSTDCYERVIAAKLEGRLPDCLCIFPNIEMRLAIGTVRGRQVNIHLLVSPEDPDHLSELKRFLSRLTFQGYDDPFCCDEADLIRLGRRHDPTATSNAAALVHGSEQFKVSFDQLKSAYRDHGWAQSNIMIAVSGGSTDGTSGVREAADTTLRQEVEKFAHVIFASSASQRDFWLGRKAMDAEELRSRFGGLKPCLHGSDAHRVDAVGEPDEERFSWLKGAPAFDSLRQAYIDPAGRAYVGVEPPAGATPSQVISRVTVGRADWIKTPALALNPGLVAIVGARGSGKTALADMIAAGCDAMPERVNEMSFLQRAKDELEDAEVRIEWGGGDACERGLADTDLTTMSHYPRARYLSQQFVEELCSSTGMTDALLREIERVIFEAHTLSDRDGTLDFAELLEVRAIRHRNARLREEGALGSLSDRIGTELEKDKLVPDLRAQVKTKTTLIASYVADRGKLVSKGSEARVARLGELTAAAEKVRGFLRYFGGQQQALMALKDDVANVRQHQSPEMLRRAQDRFSGTGLKGDDWTPFLLDYQGDVDATITFRLDRAQASVTSWKGTVPRPPQDLDTPLLPDGAKLEEQPLALLESEIGRLQKLVNFDRDSANKFAAISKRIGEESSALERLREKLADCEKAKERSAELYQERGATYDRVFDAILAEQGIVDELYAPLMARLSSAEGTLKKLSFSVMRVADVQRWAEDGEALLDLRRQGPFRGKGALRRCAEEMLRPAWENGDSAEVRAAMAKFRSENQEGLLEHSPVPKAQQADYRAWLKRFAQWLYATTHITIRYSIDYDGLDIRKLSPGTRGIVLLLLYLALDDADDRPLIIDQPEENLDPKSIFDELVGLFIAAKGKRQVIIVTHNANLVINTDADQIIVAQSGPQPAEGLPPITYLSGGLESAHIRKAVCDILEGGERAFQERARRLRVRLER